jgi:hypothetical protein
MQWIESKERKRNKKFIFYDSERNSNVNHEIIYDGIPLSFFKGEN